MSVQPAAIAGPSSYTAVLDDAWQQHLAPREADAPTVISLFAGCGGSSLGYSMAGYREVLAVERDPMACATFRLNFPEVPLYAGNIEDLTAEVCLAQSGMEPGQLDVLDGSPPCQGFSTAGKRQMADARNTLFREYVRLLEALQPRAFVMENVWGLVKARMKLVFAEMLTALKDSGYQVRVQALDAKYFGVPQRRERLIFLGIRQDLACLPTFPAVQRFLIPVREALGNKTEALAADLPAPQMTQVYEQYWHQAAQGQSVGKFFCNRKLHLQTVAHTLAIGDGFAGGTYHPLIPRGLSGGERKRLASFPDAFQFPSWEHAIIGTGNCVPPLFMRAIAKHVRTMLVAGHSCALPG